MGLYLLDYGAGNVRSLANSLTKLGYEFTWVTSPDDLANASVRPHISHSLPSHHPHPAVMSRLIRD